MAAVKTYTVKKNGRVLKTYRSLPSAKQLAEKELANVYCDGICIYKTVPEEEDYKDSVTAEPETSDAEVSVEKDESSRFTLTALMNVRKEPSLKAGIVTTLPAGTEVNVDNIKDDWLCLTDGTFILYEGGKYAVKS